MSKFSYNDIIYVGSNKPLICRDGNRGYSDSMDIRFIDYSKLKDIPRGKCVILDVSVGWTSDEDMDLIESFINRYNKNSIYIRLVDQYTHQWNNSDIYIRMSKLSIDNGIKIIGTYNVDYYDLDVGLVLPYPYLESEEFNKDHLSRTKRVILTGANIDEIYPTRSVLYSLSIDSNMIDTLSHPGYSGKHWNSGKIGVEYLKLLSEYSVMACTTCNEKYELLKYIECAEVGCLPIGDIPKSIDNLGDFIVRIPMSAMSDGGSFNSWIREILYSPDLKSKSMKYRDFVKEFRSKNLLKNKLLNFINRDGIFIFR